MGEIASSPKEKEPEGVPEADHTRSFEGAVEGLSLQHPVGGRLSFFHAAWEIIPSSVYIKDVVLRGYRLQFLAGLPTFQGLKITPLRSGQKSVILQEVQEMLVKKAIEAVPERISGQGVYSTIFLVPKKSGDLRPVINLKPLNRLLYVPHFRMETLQNVIHAVRPGEWMATLDLKDAYFHVPIHPQHRKYLRFRVAGQSYQFRALPFGLSTAPLIFTKVLAPVVAIIRTRGIHCHPYLDDLLFRAPSSQELSAQLETVVRILKWAGFLINIKKSNLIPSQDLEFIGGRFRTLENEVNLPEKRKLALIRLALSFKTGLYIPARRWLSLLGVMASCIPVVKWARLRMRPIQLYFLQKWSNSMSLEKRVIVPFNLQEGFLWWTRKLNLDQGLPLCLPEYTHVLTTDASVGG